MALHAGVVGLDDQRLEADAPLGDRGQLGGFDGYRQDRDEGAARAQNVEGAGAGVGVEGDRVEDHVDVRDGLGEVDRVIIDHLVRAEGSDEVVPGGAGGADDVRAAGLGDLHGEVTHAPAGAWIRTRCPARISAVSISAWYAVSAASGRAPAWTWSILACLWVKTRAARSGTRRVSPPRRGRAACLRLVAEREQGDAHADSLDDAGDVPAEDERHPGDGW
jgi:hypothetical protein